MPRPKIDPRDLVALLNPSALGRRIWIQGQRGWFRLWRAPGPNARFFIATTFIWSGAMALTDPYKALYLSKIGLSNLAIGGFFALEMALRAGGVLAGGLVAQRFGHKFTLLLFDFTSWTIPLACLALATEPWHVYVATVLASTNALVAGSVVQILVEDTPTERRTSVFALFSLTFVLPMLCLPALAGWGAERWGLVPVMRTLFGLSSLATLWGILWRRVRMRESTSVTPKANLGQLLMDALKAARHLLKQAPFWPVLTSFLLVNALANLLKAYYGLFVTQRLGLGDAVVGQGATLGALFFVLASVLWVPRLRAGREAALFVVLSCATLLPHLGLAFMPGWTTVLLLACFGGLIAGVHGPLLSERIALLLPPGREGLAYALMTCLMQVAVALSLVLGGALFETRFSSFPWVLGALAGLQALAAWWAKKVDA